MFSRKKLVSLVLVFSLLSTTALQPILNVRAASRLYTGTRPLSYMDVDDYTWEWYFKKLERKVEEQGETDDSDGDGVYDKIERFYNTDPNNSDSDGDGLSDYYELYNELNPLSQDSNFDGISDAVEVNPFGSGPDNDDAKLDSDGDWRPNVLDTDDDGDGIPDSIDHSPYATTERKEKHRITLKTDGNPAMINLQISGDFVRSTNEYNNDTFSWPFDDKAQIQNIDKSRDDINLVTYLKVTYENGKEYMPSDEDCAKYGYRKLSHNSLFVPLMPIETIEGINGYDSRLFVPKNKEGSFTVTTEVVSSLTMLNDYLYMGNGVNEDIFCDGKPLTYRQKKNGYGR